MIKKIKKLVYDTFFTQPLHITANDNLKGKVVIVTEASRGIGKAIATVLAQQQASLVLVARNKEELSSGFDTFDKENILFVEADVTKEGESKHIINETIKKFGRVDVLINNAGMFGGGELETMTQDLWDKMVRLNINSLFFMCKAVLFYMKKQRTGFIINIGSKISHNTNVGPNMVAYATTKYAVEGFSFALNKELKPFGIRVSCLMPGTANTVMSLDARKHISPYSIGKVIAMMIAADDIDFESVVIKSKSQNI